LICKQNQQWGMPHCRCRTLNTDIDENHINRRPTNDVYHL
jgi:hypothetical protein